MTLVDTSVWVNHLRAGSPRLASLLQESLVLTHSYVIGELACGMLKNRAEILALLQALPKAQVADDHEVLHLLESQKLYGVGLGWVTLDSPNAVDFPDEPPLEPPPDPPPDLLTRIRPPLRSTSL